jgi:hypothetical protein
MAFASRELSQHAHRMQGKQSHHRRKKELGGVPPDNLREFVGSGLAVVSADRYLANVQTDPLVLNSCETARSIGI